MPAYRAHPDRLGFFCIFNPTGGLKTPEFQLVARRQLPTTNQWREV
jgi:hypothetical protein